MSWNRSSATDSPALWILQVKKTKLAKIVQVYKVIYTIDFISEKKKYDV